MEARHERRKIEIDILVCLIIFRITGEKTYKFELLLRVLRKLVGNHHQTNMRPHAPEAMQWEIVCYK